MRISRSELRQYIQFLLELENEHSGGETIDIDIRSLRGISWWQAALAERIESDSILFRTYVSTIIAELNMETIVERIQSDRAHVGTIVPKKLKSIEKDAGKYLSATKSILAELDNVKAEIHDIELTVTRLHGRIYGPTVGILFSGERQKSVRTLKSSIKHARTLTICDPYIFHVPQGTTDRGYIKELISTLPVDTLKHLDVVYRGTHSDELAQEFKAAMKRHAVTLGLFVDESIHDRVWVVDAETAFLVGTSFGGIGNKTSFILELPPEDLRDFKTYLHELRKGQSGS